MFAVAPADVIELSGGKLTTNDLQRLADVLVPGATKLFESLAGRVTVSTARSRRYSGRHDCRGRCGELLPLPMGDTPIDVSTVTVVENGRALTVDDTDTTDPDVVLIERAHAYQLVRHTVPLDHDGAAAAWWALGVANIEVGYTCGYPEADDGSSTVPLDWQLAIAELAVLLSQQPRNAGTAGRSRGGSSLQVVSQMSATTRATIDHAKPLFMGTSTGVGRG